MEVALVVCLGVVSLRVSPALGTIQMVENPAGNIVIAEGYQLVNSLGQNAYKTQTGKSNCK